MQQACGKSLANIPELLILESQFHRHLYLPGGRSAIRFNESVGDHSKDAASNQVAHARAVRAGIKKMRMIKDVVALKARLQMKTFAQLYLLGEDQIEVHETRTIDRIPATAGRSKRRHSIGANIGYVDLAHSGAWST